MAQQYYEVDLQSPSFPMLSSEKARTVIGSEVGKAPAADMRPGTTYMHNVMPTDGGYVSVGYINQVDAFPSLPSGAKLTDVRLVYGTSKSRIYLGWDTFGNVYALVPGAYDWLAVPATSPVTTSLTFDINSVTIGTVNGVSYIFYSTLACFKYNEVSNQLVFVTLNGLATVSTLGIVSASGYLIAYSSASLAWSSTLSPVDFVPSPVTGAGGGSVAGIAGSILFCTPNTQGVLVYSEANVVAATYTGNSTYPFKFREVVDSKGGISLDLSAYEANSGEQFIFSKAGLQSINSQQAQIIFPDVTDFLAGKVFEDFNETTKVYTQTDITSTMLKKVKYVASRYVIVSYGITEFTHALVYDLGLKRMGKIKLTHTDVFEYVGEQQEVAKESIAFLLGSGQVRLLNFSEVSATGVLILGKIQAVRSRMIQLLAVEIENLDTDKVFSLYSQVSYDGKTFTTVPGYLDLSVAGLRRYLFLATGKNHSLVLIGGFNIVTVEAVYTIAGK